MDRNLIQVLIFKECESVKEILLKKNRDYGNSFAEPVQVFSKLDPMEQIKVRIDDKLARIKSGGEKEINEDTELDLIGYLILKRILKNLETEVIVWVK